MSQKAINSQLMTFLFLDTLDLSLSKNILKKVLAKNHTRNIKSENSAEVLSENLKSLLLVKYSASSEVILSNFKKDCDLLFTENNKVNWHSWFAFFKESMPLERGTFILSQVLKLSDEKISEIQNITIGTVRTRVSNCYDKFTEVLSYG